MYIADEMINAVVSSEYGSKQKRNEKKNSLGFFLRSLWTYGVCGYELLASYNEIVSGVVRCLVAPKLLSSMALTNP